jgi:hypothetical protein
VGFEGISLCLCLSPGYVKKPYTGLDSLVVTVTLVLYDHSVGNKVLVLYF